jgi:hypothetical protein
MSVHANCHIKLDELKTKHTKNCEDIRMDWIVKRQMAVAAHYNDTTTKLTHAALWFMWLLFCYGVLSYGWTLTWLPYDGVYWLFGCRPTVLECHLPHKYDRWGYLVQRDIYGRVCCIPLGLFSCLILAIS